MLEHMRPWALLAFLALPTVVSAQSPGRQPPGPSAGAQVFSETVDVRVVNVEVVVTDKRGERIPGLKPDDFELIVDGVVTPIEYFTEVSGGLAVKSRGDSPGAGIPALVAGEPVGTSYLVFVDEYFSEPRDLTRVLRRLSEQVVEMAPEDRMAIVAYDGRELAMLTSWTSSQNELEKAFRVALDRPMQGMARRIERDQADRAMRPGLRGDVLDPALRLETTLSVEERYWTQLLTDQVERAVSAATSTLRGFASPPGRKVMVLLSGGWPWFPAEYVVNNLDRFVVEGDLVAGERLFSPLIDTANLLGYTLYSVDVPGFYFTGLTGVDRNFPVRGDETLTREFGVQQTLHWVAEETGGRALINSARDRAFESVVADTRSYYWLGFTPERLGDDQRRDVKVRVKAEGLRVRNRADFFDFSKESEVTMAVESALYFGSPPSPHPLLVEVGRPEGGKKKMNVPLVVSIPVDGITFLPTGPSTLRAELELRIAVLDDRGSTADIPVIPLILELAEAPAAGTYLNYDTKLRMRRRDHDLVVALYDVPSGTMLSTSLEVRP